MLIKAVPSTQYPLLMRYKKQYDQGTCSFHTCYPPTGFIPHCKIESDISACHVFLPFQISVLQYCDIFIVVQFCDVLSYSFVLYRPTEKHIVMIVKRRASSVYCRSSNALCRATVARITTHVFTYESITALAYTVKRFIPAQKRWAEATKK